MFADTTPSPHWDPAKRARLTSRLRALAGGATGRWAFAVVEHGTVAEVDADQLRPAASTIKVPLLLTVLTEVAAGNYELGDTIAVPPQRTGGSGVLAMLGSVRRLRLDETLELMISVSDNTATNMIIDLLGLDAIERGIRKLGLTESCLRRHMLDRRAVEAGRDNLSTAFELAWLLDRLCAGELLPTQLRDIALRMLGHQQLNDRMPAYLGPDVTCLHKPGDLTGVRNDVGVLRFDQRQVTFAAMSLDLPGADDTANGTGPATEVIGAAARTIVELAR